jgi:hypothetical protein
MYPMTEVVIKAVRSLATSQGFKSLKFKNRHGIIMQDADWTAGVDYDDFNLPGDTTPEANNNSSSSSSNSSTSSSDSNDDSESSDSDDDDDNNNDHELDDDFVDVTTDEVEALRDESNSSRNQHPAVQEAGEVEKQYQEEVEQETDIETEQSTFNEDDTQGADVDQHGRPRRNQNPPREPTHNVGSFKGKAYSKTLSQVTFADQRNELNTTLEYVHNLIAQAHPKPEDVDEYPPEMALLIARLIMEMRHKVEEKGASFAQQYILQKGLK